MQTLTGGHLPLAAFRHLEPTAVGVVDLDNSITPRTPDGRTWGASQRDGLLLLRLHEQPVAVIYINKAPSALTNEELASRIWQSASVEISRHIERFGCSSPSEASGALLNGIPSFIGSCPGGRPRKPDMSVAVVVPTVGREEQLRRCLHSLLAQQGPKFEIIVVDNRPANGGAFRVVSPLAAADPRVRYIAESRGGSSVARNRGTSETDADLVAFTDDDVVVDQSWLEWLISPFADPEVTATCGMVLPLELDAEAQKHFERHGGFSKGIESRVYDIRTQRDTGLLYPFLGDLFGSGNSMAFRRCEFVAAGGFDPALGGGTPARSGEDIYAFSTAILRGGRLVYEPRALCWHEHRKDGDTLRGQIFDYGVGLGAIMTKALLSGDPRFFRVVARSLPLVIRSRQSSSPVEGDDVENDARSEGLLQTQRAGMLRGPLRYISGSARGRRLRLGDVIKGN
jgi:GT2 family glycosyltransferase